MVSGVPIDKDKLVQKGYIEKKVLRSMTPYTIYLFLDMFLIRKDYSIFELDEFCDYFYKIRIPQQIKKKRFVQLDAIGFHESSIYPDMEHIAKEQATSHFNF